MRSWARKRSEKRTEHDFFFSSSLKLMLTDNIRFRLRTDSRLRMSRSSDHRGVLGTSWMSLRGRWSVLSPSCILSRVVRVLVCGKKGGRERRGTRPGGGSVTRVAKSEKNKRLFSHSPVSLDPDTHPYLRRLRRGRHVFRVRIKHLAKGSSSFRRGGACGE